jgi:AbiTii-like protein
MDDRVPPARGALREALDLSSEILRNVELSELALGSIALKASRLARLLNDFDMQAVFEHEASGYVTTPGGVPPETYRLAVLAGREYQKKDEKELTQKYVYLESIQDLEKHLAWLRRGLRLPGTLAFR